MVTELSKMLIREEIDENSIKYINAEEGVSGKGGLAYIVDKNRGLVNATTGHKSNVLIRIPKKTQVTMSEKLIKNILG